MLLASSLVAAFPASAQAVVHLKCVGTNAEGKSVTTNVSFHPDQGWVYDGIIRMTDGVSPNYLRGIFFVIDRRTGDFTHEPLTDEKSPYKGTCQKPDTKF
jgi:hypothetical protein